MNKEASHGLMIGKQIPWEKVKGHAFRVEHFTPLASIEQGKIKEVVKFMPYALLTVASPTFRSESTGVILPVLHRVDFKHLWELYKEREVKSEEEVIVSYRPQEKGLRKIFGKTFPHLYIAVMSKGGLEDIYRADQCETMEKYRKAVKNIHLIAEWDPLDGRTR